MASQPTRNVGASAAYDAVAEAYAAAYFGELERKPFDQEVLERFAARIGGAGTVADIGCGPGQVARFLTHLGLDMLGLDIAPEMVALARKLNPMCCFKLGDMRSLTLPDDALAGAVAFYSLIHLGRAEVVSALSDLRRSLSPGAPLLISFHIGAGETYLERWFDKPVSLDFTFFGADEMTGYAEEAGFTVEQLQLRSPYPFEVQTERAYLWLRKPATLSPMAG